MQPSTEPDAEVEPAADGDPSTGTPGPDDPDGPSIDDTAHTAGTDDDTTEGAPRTAALHGSRWTRITTFWVVAALLLVLLAAVVPVIDTGSVAVPDDGVYAAQTALLARGTWSEQRPAATIDPDGINTGIGPDFVYRDRQIPYLKHPLFPLTLVGPFEAGGLGATVLVSVLGVWIASVAAGLLARRLDPSYGIPALLLCGAASPLVFDAYLVSAHGMAAGLCGLVALGVAQVVDGRRWWPLAFTLPCVALAIGLRTEAAIVMLAVAGVVGLMSVRVRRQPRLDRRAATTAACVGAVSVVAYLADAWWSRSIKASVAMGSQPLIRGLTPYRDPLAAAWVSLVRPWAEDARTAEYAIVIAVLAVVVAAVAVKVAPSRWLLPLLLMLVAAAGLVYQNVAGSVLVTGLLGAFPLLAAGLILLRRADLRTALVRRHLAIALLSAVVVTLTTYEVGGAIEWGGRFYHVLLPLLVPLVVLGLHNGYRSLPDTPARIMAAAVVVGALALSGLALQNQARARAVTHAATTAAREFAFAHDRRRGQDRRPPLVVVGLLSPDGSARMFWDRSQGIDVLTAVGVPDIFQLVNAAERHGYGNVTLMTDIPFGPLGMLAKRPLTSIGWQFDDVRAVKGTPYGLIEVAPKAPKTPTG